MRPDVFREMARVEDTHWWFRGRRSIIRNVLSRLKLSPEAAILDAGSGTGGNLAMLSSLGHVYAMELDADARELAEKRGIVKLEEGELPGRIPFGGQQFDLAVMFDVLEHIEQDFSTLAAIHVRLNPNGLLGITVPAFEFLWSSHDTIHYHKRRYSLAPLKRLVERAGYKVVFATYINFWLFPVIASVRIFENMTGKGIIRKNLNGNAELSIPPAPVNSMLEKILASESWLIRRMRLPFGVSIILVAQKA